MGKSGTARQFIRGRVSRPLASPAMGLGAAMPNPYRASIAARAVETQHQESIESMDSAP